MKRILPFLLAFVMLLIIIVSVSAQSIPEATNPDPGDGSVDVTVMSLSSSAAISVTFQYVDQDGNVDATIQKTVQALSSQGFDAADSGLPDNWVGSAIVSAGDEIAAIAQIKWQNGSSTDGKTAGAYDAFNTGANTLYFPSLASRDNQQFSELFIQSMSSASSVDTIDVYITFYDRDGNESLASPVVRTIKGGANTTLNLLTDVTLPVTDPPGDGWLGSAVVTSTAPIAGVTTMHWLQFSSAYSAVADGNTKLYFPSGTRRLPSGPWEQYTSLEVQNLDPSQAAEVEVSWYDRDNNQLFVFTDTIQAYASHGYNTRYVSSNVPDHAALHAALGADWNGSMVVESTNGVDIVGIVKLQWTPDHPAGAGASAYYSLDTGYPELFVPAVYRRNDGTWLQFTGLIVQNVGTTACNNFTVQWRNPAGTTLLSFQDSLNPSIAHGYNTRYQADTPGSVNLGDLGTALRNGTVYINAPGCSLNAIDNTVWPEWTDSTTYNVYGR